MSSKIKASVKWAALCVGMVFSGSAFSTVIELDISGADKNDVTSTIGYDSSNATIYDYSVSFDTNDIYNDGNNTAFISGSSITLNFLYGLWDSGVNQNDSSTISVLLNGSNVGSVTSNDGYYSPGYATAILDLDSSLFTNSLGTQSLTFVNDTPSIIAAIGRVELNYTPNASASQGSAGSGSISVPAPAPLALIALGIIGLVSVRKNNKATALTA